VKAIKIERVGNFRRVYGERFCRKIGDPHKSLGFRV
jgi:hypothetical protein